MKKQIPFTLLMFLMSTPVVAAADRVIREGQFSGLEINLIIGMLISVFFNVMLLVTGAILFIKYPIRTFIRSKSLGVNPLPNRRMELVSLDEDKELTKIRGKGKGYIFSKPEHFYIEPKSKKPIALIDSRLGKTISLDAYRLMNLLSEKGFHFYEDLVAKMKKDPDYEIPVNEHEGVITKDMLDKLKKRFEEKGVDFDKSMDNLEGIKVNIDGWEIPLTKDILDQIKRNGKAVVKFAGETIPIRDAVNFFSETIPGEVIETKIQYRTAVDRAREKKRDLMTWVIILGIFIICIGFAVLLISHAAPPVAGALSNVAKGKVVM